VWWQRSLQREAARGMSAECGGAGEQRWGGEDGAVQDQSKFTKSKMTCVIVRLFSRLSLPPDLPLPHLHLLGFFPRTSLVHLFSPATILTLGPQQVEPHLTHSDSRILSES